MEPIKHPYAIIAFLGLTAMCAFSLLGMRYAISRQALRVKLLERESAKLQTLDQRMDIFLAHWQHQQRTLYAECPARRVLWIRNDNRLPTGTALAYNR